MALAGKAGRRMTDSRSPTMTKARTLRLRWLWVTTKGGPIWLCIGGRKPLAHLPAAHWRRHMPVIRWRLR